MGITIAERKKLKAQARSRLAAPKPKKQRSEADQARLDRFKLKQILWRVFEV